MEKRYIMDEAGHCFCEDNGARREISLRTYDNAVRKAVKTTYNQLFVPMQDLISWSKQAAEWYTKGNTGTFCKHADFLIKKEWLIDTIMYAYQRINVFKIIYANNVKALSGRYAALDFSAASIKKDENGDYHVAGVTINIYTAADIARMQKEASVQFEMLTALIRKA